MSGQRGLFFGPSLTSLTGDDLGGHAGCDLRLMTEETTVGVTVPLGDDRVLNASLLDLYRSFSSLGVVCPGPLHSGAGATGRKCVHKLGLSVAFRANYLFL